VGVKTEKGIVFGPKLCNVVHSVNSGFQIYKHVYPKSPSIYLS